MPGRGTMASPTNIAEAEKNFLVENHEKPKIATLVFMDLESTGLPSDVGKKNVQITEMCMVAVDRHSFETDEKLRVLNKISLCVRPRYRISPGSMMITGLYNDILEDQEEFNDSVPKLLEYFFRRLQKPICLLAHNGNRFDFPVLQSELNRINYALGPDIVCADTLVAFRDICDLEKKAVALEAQKQAAALKAEKAELHHKIKQPNETNKISDEEIELLLSQDMESFACIDEALISVQTNAEVCTPSVKHSAYKEFLSPSVNEKTPPRSNQASFGNVRKRKVLSENVTDKKKIISVKRNLFPESLEIHKITKFSLENLYYHFFHENPSNSHYAEVDCISLSKVCQKVGKDFLKWVDENSVEFSSVKALW